MKTKKIEITFEDVLAGLFKEATLEAGDHSARVYAWEVIARLLGYFKKDNLQRNPGEYLVDVLNEVSE